MFAIINNFKISERIKTRIPKYKTREDIQK